MKILMTADTVGGVWTYAVELIRALSDVHAAGSERHEFVLATMGRLPGDAQTAEIAALPNVKLVASEYKLEWQDNPWEDVARAGDWLLDLEERENPEVVHLNGYAHGALPFAAPTLVVGHSCVISWWRAVKNEEAPAEWDRYRQNVGAGLAAADLVAAPSAWMLGALHEHYRFHTPTTLIYNGRSLTETGGAPADRRTVFAAGRLWDEAKNLSAVVAAAPRIEWPVRIAGEGGSDGPNVQHYGRLDQRQMADAYRAAGIYLFPAVYEPFGLSILEAALAGCALVIGDIPSLREIWRDAAIFVPPHDPAAISRAVNEVIWNTDYRDELSRRAVERAAEYTPERMAAGYVDAYARVRAAERRRARQIASDSAAEVRT